MPCEHGKQERYCDSSDCRGVYYKKEWLRCKEIEAARQVGVTVPLYPNRKPCVHGLSPRKCMDECRKRYWREAAAKHVGRRIIRIQKWRKLNREKRLLHDRIYNLKRSSSYRHLHRVPRNCLILTPEPPQIYLLPNEALSESP